MKLTTYQNFDLSLATFISFVLRHICRIFLEHFLRDKDVRIASNIVFCGFLLFCLEMWLEMSSNVEFCFPEVIRRARK